MSNAPNPSVQQLAQSFARIISTAETNVLVAQDPTGDSFTLGITTASGNVWTLQISAPTSPGDPYSISLSEALSGGGSTVNWITASYTPANTQNGTAAAWSFSVTAPTIPLGSSGASISTLEISASGT